VDESLERAEVMTVVIRCPLKDEVVTLDGEAIAAVITKKRKWLRLEVSCWACEQKHILLNGVI
jgi:hypothetical protein